MAFTIIINGVSVLCESAADAIDLAQKAAPVTSARPAPKSTPKSIAAKKESSPPTPKRRSRRPLDANLWAEMSDEGKRVAIVLRDASGPLDTHELAARAKIDAMRLKYAAKAIKGVMKTKKLDADRMWHTQTIPDGKNRRTEYSISDELRRIWKESLV